jgi:hypothetical protein
MAEIEELLGLLIQINARQAFPEEVLRSIVGSSEQWIEAYNLCDGTRSQAEVVKITKINQGLFSRTASRWIDEGVMYKVGDGRETKLLHVYNLPKRSSGVAKRTSVGQ